MDDHFELCVASRKDAYFCSFGHYDGFEDCEVPDMETWSKALNAGQYPLSVVGLSERAAGLYVVGIYGNTMTTNPRALETAIAVLDQITPELRQNIRDRGIEFIRMMPYSRPQTRTKWRTSTNTNCVHSA